MTRGPQRPDGETLRKALHVAAVVPALALRELPPLGGAALLAALTAVNALLLPRWTTLWRPGEAVLVSEAPYAMLESDTYRASPTAAV